MYNIYRPLEVYDEKLKVFIFLDRETREFRIVQTLENNKFTIQSTHCNSCRARVTFDDQLTSHGQRQVFYRRIG